MRAFALYLLCLAMVCGLATAGRCANLENSDRPDILILAFPTAPEVETIGLTYPVTVPHTQVQRDITALQMALGAQFTGIHISDQLPPKAGDTQRMTTASFSTGRALENSSHGFAIESLIEALKPYKRISLTYFENSSFKFQGLRNYQDRYVSIQFNRNKSTYTYQILINDPSFTKLNLPDVVQDPATVQTVSAVVAPVKAYHRSPWIYVLIAVFAIGLGGVAYSILSRHIS